MMQGKAVQRWKLSPIVSSIGEHSRRTKPSQTKKKDNAEEMQRRELSIDFPAMADAKDKNQQAVVFDFADETKVADSVFPKFSEF
jgi:hypothetical protein